jgi:(1->4)-alpha-D-glucan 1-alpha-D-glucosylmutase
MLKAVRESKSRTSWTQSDADFEAALGDFVNVLLGEERGRRFRAEVGGLAAREARPGLWNALSRTLVHLASPGTPDLYQGDELWTFSLVDPDNRRPVDYGLRDQLLAEVKRGFAGEEGRAGFLADLVERAEDGRIKLHVTHRVLGARRERPALFRDGDYVPLSADGPRRANLFAFARRHGDEAVVAVVPRLTSSLVAGGAAPVGAMWEGTALRLPPGLPAGSAECLLTGRRLRLAAGGEGGTLSVADLFATFPVSLLALSGTEGRGRDGV